MLISFSCSNFMSIKDEVTLSFVPNSSDASHPKNIVTNNDYLEHVGFGFFSSKKNPCSILPSIAIFGPNGSGKSSLIKALTYVHQLINKNMSRLSGNFYKYESVDIFFQIINAVKKFSDDVKKDFGKDISVKDYLNSKFKEIENYSPSAKKDLNRIINHLIRFYSGNIGYGLETDNGVEMIERPALMSDDLVCKNILSFILSNIDTYQRDLYINMQISDNSETHNNCPAYIGNDNKASKDPSCFTIKWEYHNKVFIYTLHVVSDKIVYESLAKEGSDSLLFENKENQLEIFKSQHPKEKSKKNKANILNDIKINIREDLSLICMYEGLIYDSKYTIRSLSYKELFNNNHRRIVKLLNYFGCPVKEILLEDLSDNTSDIIFKYQNKEIKFSQESTGTRKLYGICFSIVQAMITRQIIVMDEIESGLHESISYRLIELVNALAQTKNPIQLLFTTHNTNLLDSSLLRKDQIWFTNMTEERSTQLYSLADFSDVYPSDNFERDYIRGYYDAIPNCKMPVQEVVDMLEGINDEEK